MQPLKVKFIDFYGGFNPHTSWQKQVLGKYYHIELDGHFPDIIISGNFGHAHLQYDTPKIFINTELHTAHPAYADIIICPSLPPHPRYFEHTNIVTYDGFDALLNQNKRHPIYTPTKTKFCAFMYRNNTPVARKVFCKKLMKYKPVHCLGRVLRNTDSITTKKINDTMHWKQQQLHIYNAYKFTIAFENTSADGYVCEKILQPLLVGSIPIYWGATHVKQYFNPDCFINVNDFNSFEQCIEYVKKVDNDPKLYQQYITAPPILPTSKLHNMTLDKMADWLYPHIQHLLENPQHTIGGVSQKQQHAFIKWQKRTELNKRINCLILSGVRMPKYEKCIHITQEIYAILNRKIRKKICRIS